MSQHSTTAAQESQQPVTSPLVPAAARPPRAAGRSIPDATVGRLPGYVRILTSLLERGVETVSSEELALASGIGSAKLRKDLSHLGSYGVRGVGYDVSQLADQIGRRLGLTQALRVAIVGIGSLGHALANYRGFAPRGTSVVALLDADAAIVGSRVAGLVVRHVSDLESVISEMQVRIAVLATPAEVAQDVCDQLVAAGVTSVLSFAPTDVHVPESVHLRRVDLSTELAILAYREQRRASVAGADAVQVVGERSEPSGRRPLGLTATTQEER